MKNRLFIFIFLLTVFMGYTQDKRILSDIKRDSELGVSRYHEEGTTLLIETTKKNVYEKVEYLLHKEEFRSEINDTWTQYAPPLFWAMMNGNIEISELLLSYGADPNFHTKSDNSSPFDALNDFVECNYISVEKSLSLKTLLVDYGYESKKTSPIKIGDKLQVKENLRLRSEANLSGKMITTINQGSLVKVIKFGKYENIDKLENRWVKIEIIDDSKDKEGKSIPIGTIGWCYGGYLR